jgi:glycosyltransferase involved in cell wall biosynthesis
MELSFIIPVYNGAAHLEKCLTSVLSEPIDTIEVLVIDDGSTDGTADMLREIAGTDRRVKVFSHTENKLVGHCRNIGIKNASGNYLWFVDADDWLNPDSVSQMLQILKKHREAEILSFGYAEHYTLKRGERSVLFKVPSPLYLEQVHILNFLKIRTGYSSMPFSYVFKRDFIIANALYFPEGIYFEDLYFMGRSFYMAQDIKLFQRIFYNYNRSNIRSITLVQSKKKIRDLLENYHRLQRLFDTDELSGRYQNLLAFRFIIYGLPRCFRMFLCLPSNDRNNSTLRAELLKYRKSRLMGLKAIGQAAGMARALSGRDVLQRCEFRRNIRFLVQIKYAFWLLELKAGTLQSIRRRREKSLTGLN